MAILEISGGRVPALSPVEAETGQRVLSGTYVRFVKPIIDRFMAAVGLITIAIPLLAVAAAVYVSIGRPVLFRQERVGRGGQPFEVLKFRTMRPDRRGRDEPVHVDRRRTHKSVDDPRHTPLGRFLRKWSLDELPQLINVWRGEMSFVGPRPELPCVVNTYVDPSLNDRHLVLPGLTGLWQLSARSDGPMSENGEFDLEYVRSVSIVTDLKILLRTPRAMLYDQRGQ